MITFYQTIHMHAAFNAGVTLNKRIFINDLQLIAVIDDFYLIVRSDRNQRKNGACGFPTLCTTTSVIVRDLVLDEDLNGPCLAEAHQGTAGKARIRRPNTVVD